jgi:hypothetical protein
VAGNAGRIDDCGRPWGPHVYGVCVALVLLYPARPGVALTNLIIWLTDARLLLIPYAGLAVLVGGNAIFYSVICYLALRLRLRWKK